MFTPVSSFFISNLLSEAWVISRGTGGFVETPGAIVNLRSKWSIAMTEFLKGPAPAVWAGFDPGPFCNLCQQLCLGLNSGNDKELHRLVDLLILHDFLPSCTPK